MNRVSLLLEKKEELVFQHNRRQVHKEVLLWRGVKPSLQEESVVAPLGNLEILLQVKHHQCGADIAIDITKKKTRNINCSCDLHFGDCASTWIHSHHRHHLLSGHSRRLLQLSPSFQLHLSTQITTTVKDVNWHTSLTCQTRCTDLLPETLSPYKGGQRRTRLHLLDLSCQTPGSPSLLPPRPPPFPSFFSSLQSQLLSASEPWHVHLEGCACYSPATWLFLLLQATAESHFISVLSWC